MSNSPVQRSLTAEDVRKLVEQNLAAANALVQDLRNLKQTPEDNLNWENTFGVLDRVTDLMQDASGAPALMSVAHPDENVRAAAMEGEPKISSFFTTLLIDPDVAGVFERTAKHLGELDTAQHKFVTETLRDFRRNGLSLPPEQQTRLRQINDDLTKYGQAFEKNLAEATAYIEITPEQLAGLPEIFIKTHTIGENGHIRITTDNPDYIPFMKYAKDRTAARELYIIDKNRAKDLNIPLLEKMLALREEKAHLLGYAQWADYVLEPRMAKNAKRVAEFLTEVRTGVQSGVAREMEAYRAVATAQGISQDGTISIADAGYIHDIVMRETFAVNSQEVSAYFEISAVIQGLLDVAAKLFQVRFEDVQVPTWHADIRPLRVTDADGTILGTLYLDLHPRDNKYKHAAVFGLREAVRYPDGTRREAECALVGNFAKSGTEPSLLNHGEVITLFHEFGHALHHLFSDTAYTSFAGTNVARDFVEAPSQALEEYAWQREALDLFAKHYQTGEPIPDALYQKMLKARSFGRATGTLQQLCYAALDQAYHTRPTGFDTTQVMEEIFAEYISYSFVPGTHFQGTFGHLVGYDAGYYGYQWALAISRDLLTRFESEGYLNQTTATAYRKEILAPGGSDDEAKLVEHFLGRPFSTEAYTRFLAATA